MVRRAWYGVAMLSPRTCIEHVCIPGGGPGRASARGEPSLATTTFAGETTRRSGLSSGVDDAPVIEITGMEEQALRAHISESAIGGLTLLCW